MKTLLNSHCGWRLLAITFAAGTLAVSGADTSTSTSADTVNQSLNAQGAASSNADTQAMQQFEGDDAAVQRKLHEQLTKAEAFYQKLQADTDTAIPNRVVASAKGILIVNRWSGGVGLGVTGGYAIGMKKLDNGKFSAPVFYNLAGASLGLQVGGEESHTIAFLMTDKATRVLSDGKFVWSGNVKAVAGHHVSADSTLDKTADVVLYQDAKGLDVGATVAGIKVAVDEKNTRKYYQSTSITVNQILSGQAEVSAPVDFAVGRNLDQQAKNINGVVSFDTGTKAIPPATPAGPAGMPIPGTAQVPGVVQGVEQTVNGVSVGKK